MLGYNFMAELLRLSWRREGAGMGEGVSTYSLSNGKNVDNCTDRQI